MLALLILVFHGEAEIDDANFVHEVFVIFDRCRVSNQNVVQFHVIKSIPRFVYQLNLVK